jgi:hypothetical protein
LAHNSAQEFSMAANTLTGLVPTIYEALDVVSRELVGFIPAVARDVSADRAALNQVISSPVSAAVAGVNVTPAATPPDYVGVTAGTTNITITKSRAFAFGFQGEEVRSLQGSPTVPPYNTFRRDQIAQAIRAAVNEVEADLAALVRQASRAYGTAGTTPFATAADLSDVAQVLKILQDNGAPQTDLRMVLNTTASAQLRGKQSGLFRVNEAGTDELLRRGSLGDLMSFKFGESAQLSTFTKGTGASYTSSAAGFAVGTTSIPVITGTGTILAGDVITFAGDSNKYIVKTGVAAPGTIVLQEPGLRQAIPASATALTIGNSYTPNAAFHRGAFQLVARAPALPEEGDMAIDRLMVQDPVSGLPLEFSIYPGYRQVRYEVALAWGVAAVVPRHSAMLLG